MDNSRGDILVLTSWSMKEGLIQSYTLPYLKIIKELKNNSTKIHLLTLEKRTFHCLEEERHNINKELNDYQVCWLPKKYIPFGLRALFNMFLIIISLFVLIKKEKITTIHAICTPSGMLGYILSKLTGVRLVLDSFEPHSDMMSQSGTWKRRGLAYKLLFYFEKLQAKHSSLWISASTKMKYYAAKKYKVEPKKFLSKPACVNIDQFIVPVAETNSLKDELGISSNDVVCVCASKIGGMYLESEIFDFLKVASDYWEGNFKVILLNNFPKEKLLKFCKDTGLNPEVIIQRIVPYKNIPQFLSLGDFAFSPLKPIPANEYTTPIKNGEYWAAGLPIVIAKNISEDSAIIETEKIGHVLNGLTIEDYHSAVSTIDKLLSQNKESLSNKIRGVAKKYRSFDIARKVYQEVYGG